MNSIKNSTKFKSLVKELASRLFRRKLKEMTSTASIDGFETPNAFKNKGLSKKKKKNIEKQTGYNFVDEGVSKAEELLDHGGLMNWLTKAKKFFS